MDDVEELLQELDAFHVTYRHVDCLYTLLKCRFSDKIVVKRKQLFNIVQKAIYFIQRIRGVDKIPCVGKKRFLRKKYRERLMSSYQSTTSTQTSGSVLCWLLFCQHNNQFYKVGYTAVLLCHAQFCSWSGLGTSWETLRGQCREQNLVCQVSVFKINPNFLPTLVLECVPNLYWKTQDQIPDLQGNSQLFCVLRDTLTLKFFWLWLLRSRLNMFMASTRSVFAG